MNWVCSRRPSHSLQPQFPCRDRLLVLQLLVQERSQGACYELEKRVTESLFLTLTVVLGRASIDDSEPESVRYTVAFG